MRSSTLTVPFTSSAILALAAWSSLSGAANSNSSDNSTSIEETIMPGPIDNMSFSGALGLYGKPKDIPDSFVFENGSFEFEDKLVNKPAAKASTE